jgi:PTS system mannose-specific IID component
MTDMTPTPANKPEKITRADVRRSWILWTFFSHANYNYERLQATAFAHAMTPIIRKLYKTPEDISAALKRHLVFFNTEPNVGGVIHGAVIAMEEQRANGADIDDDAINSVKSGLMGPLAGIGDTISQGTITPILLAIGIGLAGFQPGKNFAELTGSPLGALFYIVAESILILAIAYFAWMQGWERGRTFVTDTLRSGTLDRLISGATVLGNMVLGALAASFVAVNIAPTFSVGVAGDIHFGPYQAADFAGTQLSLQADFLDKILPGLLPLALVILTWYLLRRGIGALRLLVLYLVIALAGSFPFFGPSPNYVTDSCGSAIFQPYGTCTKPVAPTP